VGIIFRATLSFPAANLRDAQMLVLTLEGAAEGHDLYFLWEGPF